MNENYQNSKMFYLLATVVGVVAGVPYLIATPKVQPPEQPYAIMAAAQCILLMGGFIFTFKYNKKAWVVALFLLLGIQILVFGRIVLDSISDPQLHHMWPFEFVVSTILCAPASFIGAFSGYLAKSIGEKRRTSLRTKKSTG